MNKQITIIILTWNAIEYTKNCLDTLKDHLNFEPVKVLVVDNGSTDGTVEYLRKITWVDPIFLDENLGFVKANNIAISEAPNGSDIILLNNDVEIHDPLWIHKMRNLAFRDDNIGIVGCRIRRPTGMLQHAGTYMPDFTYWGQQIGGGEKDINQYSGDRIVEGIVFACVYIKSSVIDRIGGLCKDYFSYFEDTDYCLKAQQAGYNTVNCGSLTIMHHEHVATTINRVDHNALFLESQETFKKKWVDRLDKRLDKNVCWHSTFDRPKGYGMISRNLAMSLEENGIAVSYRYLYGSGTVFPVDEEIRNEDYRLHIIRQRVPKANTPQIVFGQADAFPYVSEGYRVGYTMLETTGIPEQWVQESNQMDEIWTPSPFNAWTFRKSGVNKPITVMPLGVNSDYFNPDIIGYPINGIYTFLSIFEWGERKSPDLLIKAFNQVFERNDPVVLICKYINHDPFVDVKSQIEEMNLNPEGGHILFSENQHVPYYQVGQLYRSADCFVLPTRGEGWGMPILEAMACGLPVIASYWSAQQIFMTDANSYPLQVEKLVKAEAKCPYYDGFKWAEPNFKHLKSLLRHVYENPMEAKQKGKRAAADVRNKWSVHLSGKRIRDRIDAIESERKAGKKTSPGIRPSTHDLNSVIGYDISRAIGEQITGVGRASLNLLKGFQRLSLTENSFNFLLFPGLGEFVHPEYGSRFVAEPIKDSRFTLYRGPLPAFSDADHFVPGTSLVHSTAYMYPETDDIPLVVTVHDLTFITHPQFHTRENIEFCQSHMEKAVESRCHFFADSTNTMNDMIRICGVSPERISVVPIPIDLDVFYPYDEESLYLFRRKHDLPERFFAYVGSLEPRKNIQSILAAMAEYSGPEPLFIVGAHGWRNSDIKGLLERVGERVRVLGYIPQAELPLFYSSALATLYPSLYEGFGLPVLESMACGTPVITSNNSSIPEVAGEAALLINDPLDTCAIVGAMKRISRDDQLRSRLIEDGIAQAKRFSPEICAQTAISNYRKILSMH